MCCNYNIFIKHNQQNKKKEKYMMPKKSNEKKNKVINIKNK